MPDQVLGITATMYFSDANLVIKCHEPGCAEKSSGDSAVDSFKNWWKHVNREHPDALG